MNEHSTVKFRKHTRMFCKNLDSIDMSVKTSNERFCKDSL